METPKKNKGGRPRKYGEKTSIQSLRVSQTIKSFCQSLDNANDFLIDTITNTPEYKAFIAKRETEQYKDQPSLFKGE